MEIGVQAPVSCGIRVAGKSIVRLGLGLIQNAKVCPGCPVVFIQLNCTDVSLKSIHWLVLLLEKHSIEHQVSALLSDLSTEVR